MRPLPFAAILAVLAILGLLVYGVASKGGASIQPGDPAPDESLQRLDGKGSGRIADHRGKWVFVNFWASWCDPCREESPALQRYHDANRRDGFTVLGIDAQDLAGDARKFVAEFKLTYPQLRDSDGDLTRKYGMTGFPESFLVDPKGRIALIRRGPVDESYLRRFVTPLIRR